jgi:hypothetical protein
MSGWGPGYGSEDLGFESSMAYLFFFLLNELPLDSTGLTSNLSRRAGSGLGQKLV